MKSIHNASSHTRFNSSSLTSPSTPINTFSRIVPLNIHGSWFTTPNSLRNQSRFNSFTFTPLNDITPESGL